ETLFYAATLSLKYFTLLPFTLLFIYTTDSSEFVSSLSKFGIHYKITYAINIALRYIPDIQSEYKIIKHAQEARGVAFEKGEASLWVRMKNRVLIFWPLIIHSLERIDTVSNAMDLRGFGKKDKRTWFYTSKAKREDFIALFAGVFIFIVAVYLKLNVFQNFWYPF
ncbi:energy-coupling factor transporter transmembrane component T, partial [Bacillus thuringiensis]|nr:energy-coupling factor transporter transmembrane component T [Bacillus thuringiensis]